MDNTTISTRLTEQFGARIQRFDSHRGGDVVAYISAADLIDVATFLRDDDEMSFSFLENLCGWLLYPFDAAHEPTLFDRGCLRSIQ